MWEERFFLAWQCYCYCYFCLLLTTWFFPNPNWLVSASNWLLNDSFFEDSYRGTRDDTMSSSSASAVMILVTSRWAGKQQDIMGLISRWTRVASSGWDFNSSVAVGLVLMLWDNSSLRSAVIEEEQLHRRIDRRCMRSCVIIYHATLSWSTYASNSFSWMSYSHIALLNSQNPWAMTCHSYCYYYYHYSDILFKKASWLLCIPWSKGLIPVMTCSKVIPRLHTSVWYVIYLMLLMHE